MDASFHLVEKMVNCPTKVLGKYLSINRANTRAFVFPTNTRLEAQDD
jgi:hypothetical protein